MLALDVLLHVCIHTMCILAMVYMLLVDAVDALGSLSSSGAIFTCAISSRLSLATLLTLLGTIQTSLSNSNYVKICTDTFTEGNQVGTIPNYDFVSKKNTEKPIQWLKGLSGNLIGPDMTHGGPARAYLYDSSDDDDEASLFGISNTTFFAHWVAVRG